MTEAAVLARLGRRGGRQELRASMVPDATGRPALELRIWFRTQQGTWEPSGTVLTIHSTELHAVRSALDRVLA